jgi:hypothetical protein
VLASLSSLMKRGIYSCVDFETESFQLLTCDCHLQRNQAYISNHISQVVEAHLGISPIEEEKPQMLSSRNILVAGLGVLMLMFLLLGMNRLNRARTGD